MYTYIYIHIYVHIYILIIIKTKQVIEPSEGGFPPLACIRVRLRAQRVFFFSKP